MESASYNAVFAPALLEVFMVLAGRVKGAFQRYGKGRNPALNFGDCLTYAVARRAGVPLLYVGNDFGQTDINKTA